MIARNRNIIIIGVAITGLFILLRLFSSNATDWRESYSYLRDIPYGTSVFHDQCRYLFLDPVDYASSLSDVIEYSEFYYISYLMLTNEWDIADTEIDSLMHHLKDGHSSLIAAHHLPDTLWSLWNLTPSKWSILKDELPEEGEEFNEEEFYANDSLRMYLQLPLYEREEVDSLTFHMEEGMQYLSPTLQASEFPAEFVPIIKDKEGRIFGWKMRWGEGIVVCVLLPKLFTNYYILKEHSDSWIEPIIHYLPGSDYPVWDTQYQPDPVLAEYSGGSLSYFLSQPALRWAFWLSIISTLLIVGLLLKRKQKIIPIIAPLKNTVVDFAETIGQLYYEQQDHKALARKKIQHWKNELFRRFHLPVKQYDMPFEQELSIRSGIPLDNIHSLCKVIRTAELTDVMSENDLIRLASAIDQFYHQLNSLTSDI